MKSELRPVICAEVELTKAEIDALMVLSELHGDSACKALGQPGGKLHGLKNATAEAESVVEVFTCREVQVFCELFEWSSWADFGITRGLRLPFRKPLVGMYFEQKRIFCK